ncbi:MAG TPA: transposase [Planctomycetota bacterium]|nr:transposase [Planctomycetota bacterium]
MARLQPGARRLNLFYEDPDYRTFLGLLKKALDATGVSLVAYVLMSNHYHLMVWASADEVSRLMWWVDHSYSIYHNRKHGLTGHAFESPYKSSLQKSLMLMMYKIAYIFLNPVDAGMCDAPEEYRWTSFQAFMGLPGTDLPVNPFPILQLPAPTPSGARAEFVKVLERQAKRPKRVAGDPPSRLELMMEQFRWVLLEVEHRRGSLGEVDPIRVALYWAHKVGIPPRAMQAVLGERAPRRFRQTLSEWVRKVDGNPELRSMLAMR